MSLKRWGLRVGEKAHTHGAGNVQTGRRKGKGKASATQPCDTCAFRDHEACFPSKEPKHIAGWSAPVITVVLRRPSANEVAEQNAMGFLIPSNSWTRWTSMSGPELR